MNQQKTDKMPCPPLSERAWHDLFASMASGAATYRVENSRRDFILVDLNPAGEAIVGIPRSEFMGRNVTEAFPGIGQMGLLDVFRKGRRGLARGFFRSAAWGLSDARSSPVQCAAPPKGGGGAEIAGIREPICAIRCAVLDRRRAVQRGGRDGFKCQG